MELNEISKMKYHDLDKIIRKNFIVNLEKILNEKNLSRAELEENINVSNSSKWGYNTDNTFPGTATLLKISLFLNITINDLLLPEELNIYLQTNKEKFGDKFDIINSKLDSILLILDEK